MITIKSVKTLEGEITNFVIASLKEETIDAKAQLLLLPGLSDPHICCGVPAQENWKKSVQSVIKGGITSIIDIPPKNVLRNTKDVLDQTNKLIQQQLNELNIPLRLYLYSNVDMADLDKIGSTKKSSKAITFSNQTDFSLIDDPIWERIFQLAAWENLTVVIDLHHDNQAAKTSDSIRLLKKIINYTENQGGRLCLLSVSSKQEIDLIQEAKKREVLVYAETTPKNLFPLEVTKADFLWKAVNDGVIDMLGTGYYAEEKANEKIVFNGKEFNFTDPQFYLPLLLNAHFKNKLPIEKILHLSRFNVQDIFEMEKNEDYVLIDLEKEQTVKRIGPDGKSTELKLKGWPVYTVSRGTVYKSN